MKKISIVGMAEKKVLEKITHNFLMMQTSGGLFSIYLMFLYRRMLNASAWPFYTKPVIDLIILATGMRYCMKKGVFFHGLA